MTPSEHSSGDGDRDDLYRCAREEWGTDAQLTKAAEEFAEAAATINRMQNEQAGRDDLLEELVDAQLMLEQLQLEYRDVEYQTALDEAIADLEDRLDRYGGREVRADGGTPGAEQNVAAARSLLREFEDESVEVQYGSIKHAIEELQNARRSLPDEY